MITERTNSLQQKQTADSENDIKNPPDELIQFINSCSRFVIVGHGEPDGDCVGSQLALRSALVRLGKEVAVYSPGPFKRTELRYYVQQFKITPENKDFVNAKLILIDCSNIERAEDLKSSIEKLPCAVVDHHFVTNHPPSTIQQPVYIDPNSPSCTMLIYKLIKALGLELTKEEADLIFFGLCTDTGFFRHLTEKNSVVFEIVSEIIRCGVSPKEIYNMIHGGKSLNSRILLGHTLSRTEAYFDGRLLISHQTLEDANTFGLENRDSDTLNSLLQSIEGVEVFLTIRQKCADNCTVSLRSADKINVAQVAHDFGGGGHKN
ncbi:MAG: bifunctional oligoribonuclease/PAP phosphatase NrnA, partial [Treponema sp.]|nr:bifunctional oligoribonuclease/PAP phosphatase NrnA [Treponema sp.]